MLYTPGEYEWQSHDFYPTPPWVTRCLLDTVRLRGVIWEPCSGRGDMAKVIFEAGHQVVATDLVERKGGVFPVVGGVDALQAPLPAGVGSVCTNPPFRRDLQPQLVSRWLGLVEPIRGQLCLLLRALWAESASGQDLTTRHPAYAGRIKLPGRIRWFEGTQADKGAAPQHNHAWLVWDWNRDRTKLPYDVSAGDPRLRGCAVCGNSLEHLRAGAKTCSARCRVALARRRAKIAASPASCVPSVPRSVSGSAFPVLQSPGRSSDTALKDRQ